MTIKITSIERSKLKNKRYRVYLNTGEYFDFGLRGSSTFLEHKDVDKRRAYWSRHLGNKKERYLIENLIPSPSLFASAILWGRYASLEQNVDWLNKLLNEKYGAVN